MGLEDSDYAMLKLHALNGAQATADNSRDFSLSLKFDYVEGKNMGSQAESGGHRIIEESGSGKSRNTAPRGA